MTEFTALSYVWGNPEAKKPIVLGYLLPRYTFLDIELLLGLEEVLVKWFHWYIPTLFSLYTMSWARESWVHQLTVSCIYGFGIKMLLQRLPGFAFHAWLCEFFLRTDSYEEFQVTSNLEAALRHLRYRHQPRFLWVDAICINQSDPQERASQVLLMEFIYGMAFNVHVWLGPIPSTPGSRFTKSSAHALQAAVGSTVGLQRRHTREAHEAGLRLIASFPWWRRVWIIQEVTLASKDPIMQCGNVTFKYRKFLKSAVHDVSGNADVLHTHKLVNDSYDRKSVSSDMSPQQQLLLYLGITSGHMQATNPRDRIFGLLGLVKNVRRSPGLTEVVAHGYKDSVEEVYRKTAIWMLEDMSSGPKPLSLLDHGPSDRSGQPTWVPSWESRTPVFKNTHTLLDRTEFEISLCGMRLNFRALCLGTVKSITQTEAHDVRSNASLERLLLYIDSLREHFGGGKTRRTFVHSKRFDFQTLLDYMTGAKHKDGNLFASKFAQRLRNLHSSLDSRIVAPSPTSGMPALSDEITIPRIGAFFGQVRSLIIGPEFFGLVWEDFIPSVGNHQEEVYLVPECRSGLTLRADGDVHRYMCRVYLFECTGCLWETSKTRRERSRLKEITLV